MGEWDDSLNEGNGDYAYKNEGVQSYTIGNKNNIAKETEHNFILGNNVNIGKGISHAVVLGDDSEIEESYTVSVGNSAHKRRIVNVADGIAESDAATYGQLKKNNEEIRNTRKEMQGIGSLSAALAGLHPMQYDKKAPSQVMAALGNYRDKQALAVGVSHYFTSNTMMSAGLALSNEKKTNAMANIGFTWKIGKGEIQSSIENDSVVQNEVRRLSVEN